MTRSETPSNDLINLSPGPVPTESALLNQAHIAAGEALIEVQRGSLQAQDVASQLLQNQQLTSLQLTRLARELQFAAIHVQEGAMHVASALWKQSGIQISDSARAGTLAQAASLKEDGDKLFAEGSVKPAIDCYRKALSIDPTLSAADGNLAIALLADGQYQEATEGLLRSLVRDHGLPSERLATFVEDVGSPKTGSSYASPYKLRDRSDQLRYLIDQGRIDSSFEKLAERHEDLLEEIESEGGRQPYTPLSNRQLDPFCGYFDKLVHYRNSAAPKEGVLNPHLDFAAIEEEYRRNRCLYFDGLLSEAALAELRRFCLESTVFFRHSEAGFVGSYVAEGFACDLVLQLISELRRKLPNILGPLPINNMWCYRYGGRGHGVLPHNGDGSVTLNFWLTPDSANLGIPGSGGMVMYSKTHPSNWDWATFNRYKDDPGIQAKIAEYLADAEAKTVPYKCNRAVLFHSTLFHKTDPFDFKDTFCDRRMNITMLFGRRAEESASLR